MTSNQPKGFAADLAAEMAAFDLLPDRFKAFVRTANNQWACVPMLKRARRCGRNAYGTQERLLRQYRDADYAEAVPGAS